MTNLHISEELDKLLRTTASRHAVTPAELLDALITAHVEDKPIPLTEAQVSLLKERFTQPDRGEQVSSEQVDAFFEDLFEKIEQKAALDEQYRAARGVFLREPVMVEIELSDPLHLSLNEAAARKDQTVDEFVEDAVLAILTQEELRDFHLAAERSRESPLQPA